MKKILILCLLLLSLSTSAQFYDDFSDGNYSANPRWFMTDMDAQIVATNDSYAVELHPTGNITDNKFKKGSFRTANTLTDNTWWGCDLTFNTNQNSEGSVRFYISSSLPSLGDGTGFFLEINLKNRHINFIHENKTTEIVTEFLKKESFVQF